MGLKPGGGLQARILRYEKIRLQQDLLERKDTISIPVTVFLISERNFFPMCCSSKLASFLKADCFRRKRGKFLKKLWCCIGGDVKHKLLDVSTNWPP